MPFSFEILEQALASNADITEGLRQFVDSVRPKNRHAFDDGFEPLLVRLRAHPGDRATLVRAIAALLAQSKHVSLYADAGILPPTGFLTELYRRITHRLLPDVPNPAYLRDSLAEIFHYRRDDKWLLAVTDAQWIELIQILSPTQDSTNEPAQIQNIQLVQHISNEARNAVNVLSLRLAGLGLESELLRVYPEIEDVGSPFLTQHKEIQHWLASSVDTDDLKHASVMLDQCRAVLDRVHRNTATIGTSFRLTYLMRRLRQTITRIELLLAVFENAQPEKNIAIAKLASELCLAKARKNDIREHVTQSMDLVALRVTENAGRTGEHYITETRAEYFQMFRAALGAGFIVALMAWAKVGIMALKLPALIEVFSICGMYALSFIVMHVLHFSLATKQPAMTAAAIAGTLDDSKDEKSTPRIEKIVDMVARVTRSQLAAIVGNVVLTLPTAILLTYAVATFTGTHIVQETKALKLMHDADIRTLVPLYAAITGVVLFIGGLISGFFDNKASYSRIGKRLQAHRVFRAMLGERRATRLALYIEDNLGALAGNAALGIMLGLIGPLGVALGLPLDVRHVTLTTASVGLALPVMSFDVGIATVIAMIFGIATIGFLNLVVSFSLTLLLAFKARQVSLPERNQFFPILWRRMKNNPRAFVLPP